MRLLSLIGEQPIPNLLVARALEHDHQILVYSNFTQKVANNLHTLLPNTTIELIKSPYDIENAMKEMDGWVTEDTIFNITGGTKPMALAAYELARQYRRPVVYLQSEGKVSKLYSYDTQSSQPVLVKSDTLGSLVTIREYLSAFGLKWTAAPPANPQEVALLPWLKAHTDECISNLSFGAFEIDFVVRRGNQVAIMEAKMTKKVTRGGIDQLNTAGGQQYLGTYTKKVLLVTGDLAPELQQLATERRIKVVKMDGEINPSTNQFEIPQDSWLLLENALDDIL